jgi:hypothetical protein
MRRLILIAATFLLLAGQSWAAITYVGGKGAGTAGQGGGSISLTTGLTGGSGGAPIADDLVVVTVSVGTQARQPTLAISTPTGYTALTPQRTTSTTYDTNVQTSYKKMGSSPDTSVTIPASGNNADGISYTIQVFRGVDPATPMDVTPTYATGQATNNRPDPAAIQPVTPGAWIVVCGGGAAGIGTTLYTAAYLTNFLTYNGADTNDGTVGTGYYTGWSSGSYDPAVFGGGSVNAANSWGATTIALRPIPLGANGFVSTTPTYRHGDIVYDQEANQCVAAKFTLPGSGTQEVTEVGAWVSANAATTGYIRFAIFTHDAVNDNPDTIVADSETAELSHNTTTITKIYHTYGTKPQLTSGQVYWLVYYFKDTNLNADAHSDQAGTVSYTSGTPTYPTWPTATQWDSATTVSSNMGIYAVYQTPPSTAIKTVLGVDKASVKTVNGLAIGSVKSIDGLQ